MIAVGVTKDTRANFSHARVPKVKKIVKKSSGAPRKSRKARGKIPFAANDGSASPKTQILGSEAAVISPNAVKTTRSIFNPRGAAAEWAEAATAELTWVLG